MVVQNLGGRLILQEILFLLLELLLEQSLRHLRVSSLFDLAVCFLEFV